MTAQTKQKLGKKIDEIVSVALVNMVNKNRWYVNWRTRDEQEQWTKDDFHLLTWDKSSAALGTIGGGAVDIANEITPQIRELINSEVSSAVDNVLNMLDAEIGMVDDDNAISGKRLRKNMQAHGESIKNRYKL